MGRFLLVFAVVAIALTACTGPEDVPSNVYDLRVLGVSLDSPELLAPQCPDFRNPEGIDPSGLVAFLPPVDYRVLIVDPKGAGRTIDWELLACSTRTNRTCSDPAERTQLASGVTGDGELKLTLENLALTRLPGDRLLLERVLELDQYKGLGGLWMPLHLHLKAGEEEIWVSKLMVYNCNFFPGATPTMTQNVNPELPGVVLDGTEWAEDEVRELSGPGPFVMHPVDFKERQEPYVVPSFELQPVQFTEAWKIAWHADLGRFSPNETGGQDIPGEVRHRVEWAPPGDATEQDVRFWFVVRDGRGGLSWIMRRAHYRP
ncbi:MAG: hypothetical protein WBV82_31060 [Myxococcaceae bacterium]